MLQSCLRVYRLDKRRKQKCRSKPGRHFHLKERAMVREFWFAEKEAEAKQKVDAKWGEDEEKRKLPSEIKLFDPNSPLLDAYLAME